VAPPAAEPTKAPAPKTEVATVPVPVASPKAEPEVSPSAAPAVPAPVAELSLPPEERSHRAQAKKERQDKVHAERPAKAEVRREAKAARATLEATERPRVLRDLGFRALPEASRVFVRISAEPRFTIVEASERLIRVELPNTVVGHHNYARPLDTSFFPGAVATVTPRRHGRSTVLEIALKEKVNYQQRVDGDTLSIDFELPDALRPRAQANHE